MVDGTQTTKDNKIQIQEVDSAQLLTSIANW